VFSGVFSILKSQNCSYAASYMIEQSQNRPLKQQKL